MDDKARSTENKNVQIPLSASEQRRKSEHRTQEKADDVEVKEIIAPKPKMELKVELDSELKQAPLPPKPQVEFHNTRPPSYYVAGLGRGAAGFTTSSDISPARSSPPIGHPLIENNDEDNQEFDEFEGNDVGLFASVDYDENDRKVDAAYEAVENSHQPRLI